MKRVFLFHIVFILSLSCFAQHCPFDGSSMLVIKLTDSLGNPVTSMKDSLFLVEVDNPKPDSCIYAEGILILPFKNLQEELINKHDGAWKERAFNLASGSEFMQAGHYAVLLNQAENDCMIKDKGDFRYMQRKFEIDMKKGSSIQTLTKVSSENIYSLCTGKGPWTRIRSIEIVLK
ncbi:MAG: hypothetical protein IT214_08415 [Chitinophagaceae bacterium]|nr:hypothetical protein [Chitinophagaceae bacterium]